MNVQTTPATARTYQLTAGQIIGWGTLVALAGAAQTFFLTLWL